jgi:hypothetical protein
MDSSDMKYHVLYTTLVIALLFMLTKNVYSFSLEEQSVIDKAQKSLDLNYNNNIKSSQVAANERIIPSITLLIWTGVKDCDSIDTSKDPVSFMGLIGTVLGRALANKTQEINVTQIMANFKSRLQCIGYNWGLAIANQYQMNMSMSMSMSNITEKHK